MKNRYGLLGKNISYSFSKGYFTEKFKLLGLHDHSYENFDIKTIEEFPSVLQESNLKGLNVTIPYKESILSYLSEIDSDAKQIGAVNTIKFTENGLKGFNTDAYGFQKSLEPFLKAYHKKALILGTGGASKAIRFVLNNLGLETQYVSRNKQKDTLTYNQLDDSVLNEFTVIINCTPLGTFPDIDKKPDIPYEYLTNRHFLFDLVYNPSKTTFLKLGQEKDASICNGLKMLELQADRAWEIWNS
ncbi:shikimate dehydrogenase family protein [Flagellimonas meridianipacifica]|uniref:Shikimate dehydrogenase n=1 Tax=Flagellimonas meridianipacifica TaxID=1080225 RepID=A0A2T0M9H3_9FLAO|nr:shikimate dehydrogenase [Allomuricauda pacifica]PRX54161.1 shikimate dehydrogenase [Allomuricauda pacifica]